MKNVRQQFESTYIKIKYAKKNIERRKVENCTNDGN